MKKGIKIIALVLALAMVLTPLRFVSAQTQVGVETSTIINVHTKVRYTGYIQDATTYETIESFEYVTKEVDFDTDSQEVSNLNKEAKEKYDEWVASKDYKFAMQQASSIVINQNEGNPHDEIIRHTDGSVSVITYREIYKTIDISNTLYINEDEMLKGDLNGDGKVTADDAAEAIEKFKTQSASNEDILVADLNNDGKIDADDAALIIEIFKTSK